MNKVIIDITMSLDGFVTGLNDNIDNGLGEGGMILHDWVFNPTEEEKRLLFEEPAQQLGSCVLGRRTFDNAEAAWGDSPPFGDAEVFIPSHRPHENLQRGATKFVFVTDGIEAALNLAKESAAGKDVNLMGADISQQYLKAGLVDEINLHIANVLLGAGRPLFANIGKEQIKLETMRIINGSHATHIRYRVVKSKGYAKP